MAPYYEEKSLPGRTSKTTRKGSCSPAINNKQLQVQRPNPNTIKQTETNTISPLSFRVKYYKPFKGIKVKIKVFCIDFFGTNRLQNSRQKNIMETFSENQTQN